MNEPIDARVRERALDPQRSFIVQAPAGSGKTELLTRRVLTLLATVDEPEQVLAITFTRKAASEMRDRVIETLARAADSDAPVAEGHAAAGIALAKAVLARDAAHGWQLLRNPARLNLRTIDSLATQFATRLPVVSALGAPSGVVDDASALYREAATRFIDARLATLDHVLLQLGNRLERAVTLFADLLGRRDQWKRYVYASGDDDDALREYLEAMLAELVESRLQVLRASVPPAAETGLPPLLARAARHRAALADADPGGRIDHGWEALLGRDALPSADPDALAAWRAVRSALLTGGGELRKTLTRNEGCPTSKADASLLDTDISELRAHKAALMAMLEDLREPSNGERAHDFVACLLEVAGLPAPHYEDEQWALLSQLLTALPELLLELQVVFAERQVVDFPEMAERAQRALGTEEAPTDLALAMDLRLRHVLVDEFQDTSRTQFALFERIVGEWSPDDGRTFFAVGDPMQSIYRFRDGDVTLFGEAQASGIGPVPLESLRLETNFRSAPAVVDWINDGFTTIFPDSADPDIGAVPYAPSRAYLSGDGEVHVHPGIGSDADAEADVVARLAAAAGQGDDAHSVAILLRSRAQATAIFAALRRAEVRYRAIDMDLLGERPVVRDLTSLCLALRYPHDRLHWLALLRSPCAGLVLDDLHALMHGSGRIAVVDLLRDEERLALLSGDGRRRAARLFDVLEPAVRRAPRAPVVPWVEACWLQLGGPSVCRDATDVDAAERCIARLQALENDGQLYQRAILASAMNALYAAPLADARVQVMTLHKAKGLEFDTVILPALDRSPRQDDSRLLDWFESTIDGEPRLLLAPIEERGLPSARRHGINRMVRDARRRADRQETLRLLYVACTRARRFLHLLGKVPIKADGDLATPRSGSLLMSLWPLLEATFEAAASRASSVATMPELAPGETAELFGDALPEPPALQRLAVDWRPPAMRCFETSPSAADGVRPPGSAGFLPEIGQVDEVVPWRAGAGREIGTVVHRQLQYLATVGWRDPGLDTGLDTGLDRGFDRGFDRGYDPRPVARRQLRQLGVPTVSLDAAVERVALAVSNTLGDERGAWILRPHAEARSEWALTTVDEASGRLVNVIVDRSFVDADGTRWIIDFKTADHKDGGDRDRFLDREQDRHREQLEHYAAIIGRHEARPVRLGLYFPMLPGWRHWEPGAASKKDVSVSTRHPL